MSTRRERSLPVQLTTSAEMKLLFGTITSLPGVRTVLERTPMRRTSPLSLAKLDDAAHLNRLLVQTG